MYNYYPSANDFKLQKRPQIASKQGGEIFEKYFRKPVAAEGTLPTFYSIYIKAGLSNTLCNLGLNGMGARSLELAKAIECLVGVKAGAAICVGGLKSGDSDEYLQDIYNDLAERKSQASQLCGKARFEAVKNGDINDIIFSSYMEIRVLGLQDNHLEVARRYLDLSQHCLDSKILEVPYLGAVALVEAGRAFAASGRLYEADEAFCNAGNQFAMQEKWISAGRAKHLSALACMKYGDFAGAIGAIEHSVLLYDKAGFEVPLSIQQTIRILRKWQQSQARISPDATSFY